MHEALRWKAQPQDSVSILVPDFKKMAENGLGEAIFAAMGQSFFTLSLGIGAMAIFGSYISRDRTLTGETVNICLP